MNRKKLIILIVSVASFVFLGVAVTFALLTANDSAENKLKIAETDTAIIDDFEPPSAIAPGVTFKKTVSVQNTGKTDSFIRMKVIFSDSTAEEFCTLDGMDTENWEYRDDGYYYYKHTVAPSAATQPLFTDVTIKTTKADGTSYSIYDMVDFDMTLYAEAIQATDYAESEYLTAWADYEEQ